MNASGSLSGIECGDGPVDVLIGHVQVHHRPDSRDITVIDSLLEVEDIDSLLRQTVDLGLRSALLAVDVHHVGLHRPEVD